MNVLWAELLGGLAAVLTALVGWRWRSAQLREQVRTLRLENDELEGRVSRGATVAEILSELTPNHGGSMRDEINAKLHDLEMGQEMQGAILGRVEAALEATRDEIRGMKRDIGRHGDELVDLRRSADKSHRGLDDRVRDLEA